MIRISFGLLTSVLLATCLIARCVVSVVQPPPRPNRPGSNRFRLVDSKPGYSPLLQGEDDSARRPGNYIIKLKEETKFDDFGRLLAKMSDQNVPTDSGAVRGLSGYSMAGLGLLAKLNARALDLVRQDTTVEYVEEDQVIRATAIPWHTDRSDQRNKTLDGIYKSCGRGKNADIYILDTGINYNHVDFKRNRAEYAGYSPIVTSRNGEDLHGHGTHVAALAGGRIHGIARDARIYSLPVLGSDGVGSNTFILLALNYVAMRASTNVGRRTIVSMSLTGPVSLAVNDAIRRVTEEGIVVVTAAGNFKRDACQYSPASSPDAITVAGSSRDDRLYWFAGERSPGTNYGRCVDIFAPGQKVVSASHQSRRGEAELSGTSQATPIVAGAAAILLSNDLTLTPAELKEKLIDTSTKDALDMTQLAPSLRRVTPNRLVYVQSDCPTPTTTTTELVNDPPTCGKPLSGAAPILLPRVNLTELSQVLANHRSQNQIPVYVSPYSINGQTCFAILFKQVPNPLAYKVFYNRETKYIRDKVKNLKKRGFYPLLVTSYFKTVSQLHHFVVFSNDGSLKPLVSIDRSQVHFAEQSNASAVSGHNFVSRTIRKNARDQFRYTTLYEKNSIPTRSFCDLTSRKLIKTVNRVRNKQYCLIHVDAYFNADGETRFCAVFNTEEVGECTCQFIHSQSEKDIIDITNNLRETGHHIVVVAVQSQRSFPLFMAAYRK